MQSSIIKRKYFYLFDYIKQLNNQTKRERRVRLKTECSCLCRPQCLNVAMTETNDGCTNSCVAPPQYIMRGKWGENHPITPCPVITRPFTVLDGL